MKKEKTHIDQLYSEREEQFVTLPPDGWSGMEQKLSAPARGWLQRLIVPGAASAIVLVLAYLGVHYYNAVTGIPGMVSNTVSTQVGVSPGIDFMHSDTIVHTTPMVDIMQPSELSTGKEVGKPSNYIAPMPRIPLAVSRKATNTKTTRLAKGSKVVMSTVAIRRGAQQLIVDNSIDAAPVQSLVLSKSTILSKSADTLAAKEEVKSSITIVKAADDTAVKNARIHTRFNLGFHAGYESALANPRIDKLLAGISIRYNISGRWSVALVPSFRYGQLMQFSLPGSNSYYNITSTTVDTQIITKSGHPFWHITYRQRYDSVIVTHRIHTTILEAEAQLLLSYKMGKRWFLYGGPVLNAGTVPSVTDQLTTFSAYQEANFTIEKNGVHPVPDTSHSFHHSAPAHNVGDNVAASSPQSSLRTGYALGIGYEYLHWNINAMLLQNVTGYSSIPGAALRQAYAQPYFSFRLGFMIGK